MVRNRSLSIFGVVHLSVRAVWKFSLYVNEGPNILRPTRLNVWPPRIYPQASNLVTTQDPRLAEAASSRPFRYYAALVEKYYPHPFTHMCFYLRNALSMVELSEDPVRHAHLSESIVSCFCASGETVDFAQFAEVMGCRVRQRRASVCVGRCSSGGTTCFVHAECPTFRQTDSNALQKSHLTRCEAFRTP